MCDSTNRIYIVLVATQYPEKQAHNMLDEMKAEFDHVVKGKSSAVGSLVKKYNSPEDEENPERLRLKLGVMPAPPIVLHEEGKSFPEVAKVRVLLSICGIEGGAERGRPSADG